MKTKKRLDHFDDFCLSICTPCAILSKYDFLSMKNSSFVYRTNEEFFNEVAPARLIKE